MNIEITEVVNKYSNMVLRLAYQKVFNMSDAEDVTQEVFIRLMSNKDKIQDKEHLKAWLIRVTVNLSTDYNKNFWNKNVSTIEDTNFGYSDNESEEILDELRKLKPPIYRDIIYLYFYEGYKIREIAKLLNLSENTVSSGLTRAKHKLRKILEEEV